PTTVIYSSNPTTTAATPKPSLVVPLPNLASTSSSPILAMSVLVSPILNLDSQSLALLLLFPIHQVTSLLLLLKTLFSTTWSESAPLAPWLCSTFEATTPITPPP